MKLGGYKWPFQAKFSDGIFKVIHGSSEVILKKNCMNLKLGGYNDRFKPNFLTVF